MELRSSSQLTRFQSIACLKELTSSATSSSRNRPSPHTKNAADSSGWRGRDNRDARLIGPRDQFISIEKKRAFGVDRQGRRAGFAHHCYGLWPDYRHVEQHVFSSLRSFHQPQRLSFGERRG